jgi:Tfp pilus assembly protein PilZ
VPYVEGIMNNDRYKAQIAAKFLSRSQTVAFLTDHVSALGVFVRTDSPPPVMELVRIEFSLPPSNAKIVMNGMVSQLVSSDTKNTAPGAEIAFFAKGGESGRLWDEFVQYVREKHPEAASSPVKFAVARDATDQIRRAHPRIVPSIPIAIGSARGASPLSVGDISDGGMFIRTNEAFAVGSDLRVTLQDPRTLAPIPLDCIVRRRATGPNAGIGVEFRNMSAAQRDAVKALVLAAGSVPPPVPARSEEVRASRGPRMMQTLPGPGYFGAAPSIAPKEDSWASIDEGWPSA